MGFFKPAYNLLSTLLADLHEKKRTVKKAGGHCATGFLDLVSYIQLLRSVCLLWMSSLLAFQELADHTSECCTNHREDPKHPNLF